MTRNDTHLHELLVAERQALNESIGHYEVVARHKKPGLGNHMADDATEAFDQAAGLALHLNEQALLSQVESALERMEKGTYGLCERCGEDIDYARLEAIPYATLCIRCQQHLEEHPRGNGSKR
jgi:DnaK suppressor protein